MSKETEGVAGSAEGAAGEWAEAARAKAKAAI